MLDAKAVRGMYVGSDHYVVLTKTEGRWDSRINGKGKVSKVPGSERMDRKEVKEVYDRNYARD